MSRLSATAMVQLLQAEQVAHGKTREQYAEFARWAMAEIASLKREGFQTPIVMGNMPQQPQLPESVLRAVEASSLPGRDRAEREAQAWELQGKGLSVDEVAELLIAGEQPQV